VNDIREDIKAYLDGELSPERAQQVETVIHSDPTLQAEVKDFERIGAIFQREVSEPPSQGLEQTLLALTAGRPAATPRRPMAWGWAFALAGFVVGILAVPRFTSSPSADSGAMADRVAMKEAAPAADSKSMDGFSGRRLATGAMMYGADTDDFIKSPNLKTDAAKAAAPPPPASTQMQTGGMPPTGVNPMAGAPVPYNGPPPMVGRVTMSGRVPIGPAAPFAPQIQAMAPSPEVMAALETAVRRAVSASTGTVMGSSALKSGADIVGRSILVSVDGLKADQLVATLRKIVGPAGSVSDPIVGGPSQTLAMSGPAGVPGGGASAARGGAGFGGGGFGASGRDAQNANAQADNRSQGAQAEKSSATDAAASAPLQDRLTDLKVERAKLLVKYYEDAAPVKEIDDQIAAVESELAKSTKASEPAPSLSAQTNFDRKTAAKPKGLAGKGKQETNAKPAPAPGPRLIQVTLQARLGG